MPGLSIRIRAANSNVPAFDEITKDNFLGEVALEAAAILEAGMKSGKTSVMFLIGDAEGKYVIAQTSALIIDGLWHAIRGADARWGTDNLVITTQEEQLIELNRLRDLVERIKLKADNPAISNDKFYQEVSNLLNEFG